MQVTSAKKWMNDALPDHGPESKSTIINNSENKFVKDMLEVRTTHSMCRLPPSRKASNVNTIRI